MLSFVSCGLCCQLWLVCVLFFFRFARFPSLCVRLEKRRERERISETQTDIEGEKEI